MAHALSPATDIANDLEEYLAHLNRTAFSFDGGPSLDFAEAALLIQSSACVYSKKVGISCTQGAACLHGPHAPCSMTRTSARMCEKQARRVLHAYLPEHAG